MPCDPERHAVDGEWENERGSRLSLKVDGFCLRGTYRTAVGTPDKHDEFVVVGQVVGNVLGFVVAWSGHESLTSWAGRYDAEYDRIHTLWLLVNAATWPFDPIRQERVRVETQLWESFRTQQSVFKRVGS